MRYQINLLQRKKESLTDRIIYFSLNYLRYILVVTQIVVIFVFFYKFRVDQEIIDLKEAVDQKKEIIKISEPLLKMAEETEQKINYIKPILKQQQKLADFFNYFSSVFPEAAYLTKLDISGNKVEVLGFSGDPLVIRAFYNRLRKDKRFKQVNLRSIRKTDVGFEFTLGLDDFIL